jgi:pimeloyl-ACP methyl ester carboxylesterase
MLDDLETVKTPVRPLVGRSSVPAFAVSAQVALQRLPRGELVTLNGHNHFATLVAPDLIASEVLKSNAKSTGGHR